MTTMKTIDPIDSARTNVTSTLGAACGSTSAA